jgi:hypothetical protein
VPVSRRLGIVLFAFAVGCHHNAPTQPADSSLSGSWTSSDFGRLCVGDWSSVTLDLQQSGTSLAGEITTLDGVHIPVTGSSQNGTGSLSISFPPNQGMCEGVVLTISKVTFGSMGQVTSFSGHAGGMCCGTVAWQYQFSRVT